MKKQKLIIIDGNSWVYRAYYATYNEENNLKTKDGKNTNALLTFIKMFKKNINGNEHVVVVFDKGKPNIRLQIDPNYKGTRKPTPEPLKEQMCYVKEFLDIFGINYMELDDYEADDIAGTLAKRWKKIGCSTIYTSDKDLLQLIDDDISVKLIKNMSDIKEYDVNKFIEDFQIYPKNYILYKAIAGDKSDNITGVKGIGEKGALKLAKQYDSLDILYKDINTNKIFEKELKKYKKLLLEKKEEALKSYKLAKIITDVPLGELSSAFFRRKEINEKELKDFYEKYELNIKI